MRGKGKHLDLQFCPYFLLFWGPNMGSKIRPKFVNFWVQFWPLFFWGLGALWMPLGSLLGPLEALLGGLKSEKCRQSHAKATFLRCSFLVFEALDGPLGLVLFPSWADLVPKWAPKWAPKKSKKLSKSEPKMKQTMIKFSGQNLPKKLGFPPIRWDRRLKAFFTKHWYFGHFCFGALFFLFLSLGSLLGLLRFSWEASGPKNLEKLKVF